MDRLDNIGENEIRVIGPKPKLSQQEPQPHRRFPWMMVVIAIVALAAGLVLLFVRGCTEQEQSSAPVKTVPEMKDSIEGNPAYVEMSDTMINNISLHRYVPVNARPKLVVGVVKEIPEDLILGAMAADYGTYNDHYEVVGAFVYQGELRSHSKSKYGFCAILKDTLVIGNALATSFFEKAIEEKGDFFRQHALVSEGKVVCKVISKFEALRRSLCRLNDGRLCIIETDMRVTFSDFAEALCKDGVSDAIALAGSGAAVRWAVDIKGRRFFTGADEYDFPDVVNYIVWEKPHSERK
jgi:hypothetical protein